MKENTRCGAKGVNGIIPLENTATWLMWTVITVAALVYDIQTIAAFVRWVCL